ncbi:fasciclin domain-containing protein [Robertkochia marina]|nr:fasciclin domain-containing protein [Robertkochia marina]
MKALYSGLILILFLGLTACNNDDDNNGGDTPDPPVAELTIYETAVASADLTTLVAALDRTGLNTTLDEQGTYTVFAPTNDAFTAAGITSLDDFTDEELTNYLLNHVLNSVVRSGELSTGYVNTLGKGPGDSGFYQLSLFVDLEGGVTFNGMASPVEGGLDIEATNGVIHLIDMPLPPPNVVEHVVANPDFQSLEDFVVSFEDELTGVLVGDGPFTIFAPTNQAFANIANTPGLDLTDENTLRTILLYHVVAGDNIRQEELTPGMPLTTLTPDGELLYTDSEDGTTLVDGTGGSGVNFIETNIQGANGVIHKIDKVLLPPSIVNSLVSEVTLYDFAKATAGYDQLAAAIEKAGLVDMLSDPEANLTVFAPNNDALAAYLTAKGTDLETVDAAFLKNVLMNHMIEGQFTGEQIVGAGNQYTSTLATLPDNVEANLSMYIQITPDGDFPVTINGAAGVLPTNSQASNGIVHVVSQVIDLPTIVTFATSDENFSTLAGALPEDIVATLNDPENEDAPFTVFAPVNSAFEGVNLPSGDILVAVLLHHVVAGVNVRSGDLAQGDNPLTTMEGDQVTVTVPPTIGVVADITDGTDNTGGINVVDVQAINGVIHAIDIVLLPNATN